MHWYNVPSPSPILPPPPEKNPTKNKKKTQNILVVRIKNTPANISFDNDIMKIRTKTKKIPMVKILILSAVYPLIT